MKTLTKLVAVMSFAFGASSHGADKTLIDYFLPTPIAGSLVSDVWGAPGVSLAIRGTASKTQP
jgi:hypothetical protein